MRADTSEYTALAMPNGAERFGGAGPIVMLVEHTGGMIRRERPLTEAEAQAMMEALQSALRDLAAARRFSEQGGAPEPYRGRWPIHAHRTLAEVDGR